MWVQRNVHACGTWINDHYTFESNGIQGIGLNTSLIKYSDLAPREAEEQSAWYTADGIGVAVLFNIDPWNAVNTAAEHVAGMYAPGVSISSLPQHKDDTARTARFIQFLNDLASSRDTEMLTANLRGRISPDRRKRIAAHLNASQKVTCADVEEFGTGQEQLGDIIIRTERYHIATGNGAVYYTLNFDREGKIIRFIPEED